MPDMNNISRRRFVKLAALSAGSVYLLPRCTESGSKWRYFSEPEAVLTDALADQIIPPDEWPGGRESGVTNYIDKQLVGPYRRYQEKYRSGLALIQEISYKLYKKKFEELETEVQTVFLESLEAGKFSGEVINGESGREFFELIRDHSMQAYYGSSRHGGNRNNLSYKMLKLDYPLIIGQNRYKT
jgi:gluconate 2-dehydrogenase gamma chain